MTGDIEAYSRLAGVYDEIVVDPCYDRWACFLHTLWGEDGHGVRSVLDVCCGTGLLTAELVDRGYDLVGLDSSAPMLARARTRLGPGTPLLEQTLPHLEVLDVFDAAISSFDGLNYLTPDDFATTLDRLAAALRPGGWLVFDLHTDAMMAFTLANPVVTGEAHGWAFTITSEVDPAERTCRTRIEAASEHDDAFTETHEQFFHSDSQVHRALGHAGFDRVSVVDEYSSIPADATTLRATWIARRSPT